MISLVTQRPLRPLNLSAYPETGYVSSQVRGANDAVMI